MLGKVLRVGNFSFSSSFPVVSGILKRGEGPKNHHEAHVWWYKGFGYRTRGDTHRPAVLCDWVVEQRVDVMLVSLFDHRPIQPPVIAPQKPSLVRKVLEKHSESPGNPRSASAFPCRLHAFIAADGGTYLTLRSSSGIRALTFARSCPRAALKALHGLAVTHVVALLPHLCPGE